MTSTLCHPLDHCWHNLESQSYASRTTTRQLCCFCGSTRWEELRLETLPGHGPFYTQQAFGEPTYTEPTPPYFYATDND